MNGRDMHARRVVEGAARGEPRATQGGQGRADAVGRTGDGRPRPSPPSRHRRAGRRGSPRCCRPCDGWSSARPDRGRAADVKIPAASGPTTNRMKGRPSSSNTTSSNRKPSLSTSRRLAGFGRVHDGDHPRRARAATRRRPGRRDPPRSRAPVRASGSPACTRTPDRGHRPAARGSSGRSRRRSRRSGVRSVQTTSPRARPSSNQGRNSSAASRSLSASVSDGSAKSAQ